MPDRITGEEIKAMLGKPDEISEGVEIEYIENDDEILTGRVNN